MSNIFLISDTHFGHQNTCTLFKRADGSPLRPFSDADEMNEIMVDRWNSTVKPSDKVYHLGDVVINRKYLDVMGRLNGTKVLIKGNHDIFKLKYYLEYFKDIRSCHVLNGMIFTHIPIHKSSLARFGSNVHGHLHATRVMDGDHIDSDYYCVSVENINYTPISLEDLSKCIKEQGGKTCFRN
jgi:calcineurin-like phosphoesterase family protein